MLVIKNTTQAAPVVTTFIYVSLYKIFVWAGVLASLSRPYRTPLAGFDLSEDSQESSGAIWHKPPGALEFPRPSSRWCYNRPVFLTHESCVPE